MDLVSLYGNSFARQRLGKGLSVDAVSTLQYFILYMQKRATPVAARLRIALFLNGSLAVCYSRMGVKAGLSGTQFLPHERPELCEGLGIHFVKVCCRVAFARSAYTKKP
jgi:hypothetical protein